MTVHQLQLILDFLWQRYGQAGDKCGCMFKLADLLAMEESRRISQKKYPPLIDGYKKNFPT